MKFIFDGQTDKLKGTHRRCPGAWQQCSWYYLSTKPNFFDDVSFPAIGPNQVLNQGTIPALIRLEDGQPVYQPDSETSDGTDE